MAWTEKYVDLADGGSGDGSSGDPWASFAEAISEIGAISAPTKIYVRGNGSLSGALAFSTDGTTANPVVWVGCTGSGATWTPIGDSATATKPTLSCSTNQVTVTGDYQQFENIAFTGAVTTSGGLVSNTSAGIWATFIRCRFTNTASNANSRAVSLAGAYGLCYACFIDCVTSGTAPTYAAYISGSQSAFIGCHIRGGESNIGCLSSGVIAFNILEACDGASAIIGDSSSTFVLYNTITGAGADGIRQTGSVAWTVMGNLIHSATSIAINNSAADNYGLRCFNNMFYNCGTNAVDGTPENMAWESTTAGADPLPNLTEPANNANDFVLAASQVGLSFPGIFEAGAYAFQGYMSHGAVQPEASNGIAVEDIVAAQYVLTGHDTYVGGSAGTLTLPAVGDVQDGVTYGVAGTGSEGTFAVPAIADVRDGTTYGAGGTEYTGEMLTYSTWTETEKSHIRYRLGIDGTEAAPTNTPTLGTLTANVTQWNGTNVSAPNVAGVPKVDVAYVLGEEVNNDGSVNANVVTVATDAIDADALAADAGTEIGAAVKTAIEAAGSHLTLILEDTGTTLPATLDTIDNFLDTEVAAILQDTDELQKAITDGGRTDLIIDAIKAKTDLMLDAAAIRTALEADGSKLDVLYDDWLNGGRLDLLLDAAAAGGDVFSTELPGAYAVGTAGYIIGTNLDAKVSEAGGGAGDGTGADEVTIAWTSNGLPVGGGDVWITTDPSGDNVVAGTLQTNDNGQATFMLDDGSVYFLWGQRSGVNSIRGERFVAVAD